MKDFSKVKGTLKGWTEKSAIWYENASEYTGYHDRLSQYLLRFLKPEDRCCEIACGTGILARKTVPYVSAYTANDADPEAVSFLKRRLQEAGTPDIEVLEGEWQEVLAGRKYDVILTSYYGVPVKFWPLLTSLAGRSFIVICPRNERWRILRNREEASDDAPEKTISKLDTPGNITYFLRSQGIPFETLPLDLEFGQIFVDREEAREYIQHYYQLEGSDAEQFLEEKTVWNNGKLYFPKKKEIEVIVADLSGTQSPTGTL